MSYQALLRQYWLFCFVLFERQQVVLPRLRLPEDDLKLPVLLASVTGVLDYGCTPLNPMCLVLRTKARASYRPGKHLTD